MIKTAGTLLHITPYQKMNSGLASVLIEALIKVLLPHPSYSDSALFDLDLTSKLSLINTLSIALNSPDIKEEVILIL